MLFAANKLVTVSSDQTLRIWDLKGSNFSSNPGIIYDHEEEIVQAVTNGGSLVASMDVDGRVLVRDVRS